MKTNKLVVGILAHVDAGKTTLAENILYTCGAITKKGRVDHQDTFLDTHSLERERGITIFSKQAFFSLGEWEITLLDTPGHVDFGAEMERTLQVLDYGILVINGNDGVQSHTLTLWKLLKSYQIPVFLFVNKMDREENDAGSLIEGLKRRLSADCLDFGLEESRPELFFEELAMKEEGLLEGYLEGSLPSAEEIGRLIAGRKVFPVYFGSALKDSGVSEFLNGMKKYFCTVEYPPEFGARVFKIGRDNQNNRLTYVKITGGSLKVKQLLEGVSAKGGQLWQEKADQIRLYSGDSYALTTEAEAGQICVLTGLYKTYAGEALGAEEGERQPYLEPVLTYRLLPQEGVHLHQAYEKLETLCQEEPELSLEWMEALQEIHIRVMGEIQLEVLKCLIEERFGMKVEFGNGHIVYKETISDTVEGVGHFEPLRHYAEVHLLLEPLPAGAGLEFVVSCREDVLDRNWQRLVLTHLKERQHPGILTGSVITDMRITLLTGRSHPKHTEGGDFRQATYRAIRQGLCKAESILLEPIYAFTLEVPQSQVGRAMSDILRMAGKAEFSEELIPEEGMSILVGTCPVVTMGDYHREVLAYTQGKGRLNCRLKGYEPCHNMEEVLEEIGYDPGADIENPCGSIFCSHGAGTYVGWDEVEEYMHLEMVYHPEKEASGQFRGDDSGQPGQQIARQSGETEQGSRCQEKLWQKRRNAAGRSSEEGTPAIGTEEIDAILNRAHHANKKGEAVYGRQGWNRKRSQQAAETLSRSYGSGGERSHSDKAGDPGSEGSWEYEPRVKKEPYLLVDGYNVIFAWKELKELAAVSLDGARGRLIDVLCDYQAMKGCQVILVFDAYRLQGHQVEILDYHNIHVVYTKEAETADQYIEKFTHRHSKEYQITVATSDGLEQIIIRGQGCSLLSARELAEEISYTKKNFMEIHGTRLKGKHTLGEYMPSFETES